jgi:hypothetical protein
MELAACSEPAELCIWNDGEARAGERAHLTTRDTIGTGRRSTRPPKHGFPIVVEPRAACALQ